MPNDQSQLDPSVLNLMSGIRQVESGGKYDAKGQSGEYGAYQYTHPTWQADAGKYLGDPNADVTDPANQNKVAYMKISALKGQGMNPSQIASYWNSGRTNPTGNVGVNSSGASFDTPDYVNKVLSAAQEAAQARRTQSGGLIPQAQAAGGPQQGASQGGPSVSGFIGNTFNSAGNLLGSLGQAALHPIKTTENVLGTLAGGGERLAGSIFGQNINNEDTQKFDGMVNYFKHRYGGDSLSQVLSNIGHTAYTDPVGMALDVSTLLDGIGGAVGAVGKISKVSEIADAANSIREASSAINPITRGAQAAGAIGRPILGTAGKVAKGLASHLTGMEADDMATIMNDPTAFSKVARASMDRSSVLDDTVSAFKKYQTDAENEAGAAYDAVRASGKTAQLPEDFLSDILKKGAVEDETGKAIPFKWNLEEIMPKVKKGQTLPEDAEPVGYKATTDTSSMFDDPQSRRSVSQFVNKWAGKTNLTPEEFMNMRREAAKLGKMGRQIGENQGAGLIGRAIQGQLNKIGRPHLTGLAEADAEAAPKIQLISKVEKDLFSADGTLKDNSASKIANALNKPELMKRLEEIHPGITHKLEVLKAVEGIEKASGIKTATYTRGGIEALSVATGNVPLVVGMIMTHPQVATQILRGFGYVGQKAAPVLARVRLLLGALPKEALGTAVKAGVEMNQIQKTNPGK